MEWFGEGPNLQVLTRPIQVSRKRGVDALYPFSKFAWKVRRMGASGIKASSPFEARENLILVSAVASFVDDGDIVIPSRC